MKRFSIVLAILLLAPVAAHAESFAALGAPDTNTVYRNAMYLFLRVAGVAWIGLEWVAAFVLWRAYRLLRDAAAARTSADA